MNVNATHKTITKYLSTYAETDIQALRDSVKVSFDSSFSAVLVLPVFDEPIENLCHFLEFETPQPVVLIWVFNCPDNALKEEQERTQCVMNHFIQLLNAKPLSPDSNCYCSQRPQNKVIYILNRCSQGNTIPAKQGVGLARKLGMDFALMLLEYQYNRKGKRLAFIHSSDADVTLPEGYFDIPAQQKNCSAIIYPFQHIADKHYRQAMALYDISLRYYVDRLAQAGSPYAFHTIGSLIAVAPLAYAQVRGMPKRSGAEDFYLLNKLAKVGKVINLEQPLIKVSGRPSHRVPFGTGPALIKLQKMNNPLEEYRFYHPRIFVALKHLLDTVSEGEQSIATHDVFFSLLKDRMSVEFATQIIETLQALKFESQYQHLSQKLERKQFIRAFHTWFDAFITLRFIHIMRDKFYPNITLTSLQNNGVRIESYQEFSALGI